MKNKSTLKYILLIFSVLTLPFASSAQSDTLSWNQINAMNLYVDFTNDNIHALWNYHNLFTKFNKSLLEYQELPLSERGSKKLEYEDKSFLRFNEDFKVLPGKSYLKAEQNSDYLPAGLANQLNTYLEAIWLCSENVETISSELETYIESGAYQNDPALIRSYEFLEQAEEQYNRFHKLISQLASALKAGYDRYAPPDPDDPFVNRAMLLVDVLEPCSDILASMREDDPVKIESHLITLDLVRELYVEEVGDKLNEVRFLGDDNPEPHIRYDFILQQVDKFRDYTQTYLNNYDSEYRIPHGNSWFYYNKRLINQYNRFGRGLALQYNKYIDSTGVIMLKAIEASNWMKATRPEDFEIPPEFVDKPEEDTLYTPIEGSVSLEGYAYNNLVFLLDVSSSMNKPGKLDLLQSSFKFLVKLMRPEDRVAVVTYSGDAKVVLPSTSASASHKKEIIAAIDSLESKGTSKVIEGFFAAKRVAERNFIEDGNNKIILASDGAFDEDKKLGKLVKELNKENISLTVFYYSKAEKQEEVNRLRKLSRLGKGTYAHIKDDNSDEVMVKEAQKVQQEETEEK